ncbi:autophagy-related protein 2 [Iris pallida]|uniref:Autophagy-related protein 2 n=1 Tax=Iris pallida TaxID=29817 RepID=A0AAX6E4C2_IRIPA|nr:autophagy-related protein 2 [Iris pallida]KAJ6826155.1 autophagy-related protein 2 [Iris pallida]
MFSRWDLARSAEAMFSRWAIKRVCKFLLKKRLGDFILGDIDLDQLDVQLTRGTIHLSDLALNADLLNQKMAGSAVMVKEGSIASLSIKIPWKLQNCQIEVEELELVLAPYVNKNTTTDAGVPSQSSKHCMGNGTDKHDTGSIPENSASVSLDIHEGVKTIAKIVKWFLTSFHVRLRNLIVAFDPCLDVDVKATDPHRSLVLRIEEIEYGTCVSEDPSVFPNSKVDSLIGKAKLTNFVKFQGALIEFLKMDDVDNSPQFNSSLGTSFSEWQTGNSTLRSTVTVLAGANGGFSGRLNLSIPWKNGSLDIRKVDADFSMDPLQLSLQPSTIKWLIVIWESLKNVGATSRSHANYKAAEPIPSNSRYYNHPSTLGSSIIGCDAGTAARESLSKALYSAISEETLPDVMLPRTHVIHNWVPLSINEDAETELEQDYGASIDQFFECFDGMRSSQANSGNSGIWHWTCSVFSAITVASNLASGSVHIPIEQQNVETSLRAAIAEVSVLLSFDDGKQNNSHDLVDEKHLNDPSGNVHGGLSSSNFSNGYLNANNSDSYMSCLSSMDIDKSGILEVKYVGPNVHHLEAKCQNVAFNLQISPQKTKFEASIMHAKVYEYHDSRIQAEGFGVPDYDSSSLDRLLLSKNLQEEVQGALPPFPFSVQEHDSESSIKSIAKESEDGLVKVVLFESFGIFTCHFAISSIDLDGITSTSTSTSFSVHLPPFIFWIHFAVVNMLLNLLKQVESSFEETSLSEGCSSGVMGEQHNPSVLCDDKTQTSPTYPTTVSSKESLQGSFFLPHARIIFCFPSEYCEDFRNSSSFDEFIILEHSPSHGSGNVSEAFSLPASTGSSKGNSCAPSTSIQFSIGDFNVYLAGSARKDYLNDKYSTLDKQSICAVKILSGTNGTVNHHSGVTMIWQKGPVTGPWMAGRAWSLTSSHGQSRNKVAGKSCEFSSVTTAEDSEETSSHIRQELILSSAFFLHVQLSHVWFNLSNHDLIKLNNLLKQSMSRLSNEADSMNTASTGCVKIGQSSHSVNGVSQSSIFIDCGVLDLCVRLDEVVEVNYKIQKELEGSWNSFRLNIKKIELLSVSNIGGVSDATLFWLNHGEGELWGSVLHSNKKAEDLLLVTCSNSTIRRGDGKGANALSFGSAGTTIQYLQNPQALQSSTSVIVRGGTIIAPGGRVDWISAICLFFSLPHDNESSNSCTQSKSSADDEPYKGSFFLDLVDVALSYEPYTKGINEEVPDVQGINSGEINEGRGEQCVAGLLAAASLSLSNYASAESAASNYNIQVHDVGLLICESSGPVNATGGYHASDLRKAGYVKVAQVALVQAVIRIKDLLWEIDCAESHINLDTCHDTTNGLIRLGAQLQQLYAPDIEDALSHLQSRWNTVQQKDNENILNDVGDNLDSISVRSDSDKLPNSDDEGVFVGLLDEILENAFNIKEECRPLVHCESHPPVTDILSNKRNNYNISTATSGSSLNSLYGKSKYGSGSGNSYQPSVRKISSPQIIEGYYLSEVLSPSNSQSGSIVPDDHRSKFDVTVRNDECGKGGWYEDDSLMIVENHISKVSNQPVSAKCQQKDKSMSLSTDPAEKCREKGRMQFRNIDFRWRMYAGLDWPRPRRVSNLDSHARDESVTLELVLSGLNLQSTIYPDGEISVSKLSLSVQDFHLCDRSKNAPWKMMLGYYNSKDHHRESCAKAFQVDLETVRPDPLIPVEDYRLVLEFMPMRLHLDQGQLNFLISFFGKGSFDEESPTLPNDTTGVEMRGEKSRSYGSRITVEEALLPFFQATSIIPTFYKM